MGQDEANVDDQSTADEQLTQSVAGPPESGLTEEALEALPLPDPDHPVDKADVIGEAGKWLAAWSGRFLLIAAAGLVIGWVTLQASGAAIPVMLGLLVASVLWPLVNLLNRAGLPYGFGALLSLLAGVGIIAGLFSLIAPAVASQWGALSNSAISGIRQVQEWVSQPPFNLDDGNIDQWISRLINWLQGQAGDIFSTAVSFGGSIGSFFATLVITLMITFFMLKDGHRFPGWIQAVVGRRVGFHAAELFARIWNTISGYIRTQAIVSLVDAVFIGLGIWILGVPLAFPIAVLTFVAGFIPIVGAFTAGTLAVLVALVANGFWTAVAVLVVVLLVQQLEGNVLQPFLQARVMELHPVIVLLAVLLGGAWAGILGAFLAVPVAATVAVVLRYLGDLANLRTGEVKADDIHWLTDSGRVVGTQSERSAVWYRDLMLRRKTAIDSERWNLRNPFKKS